MIFTLMIIYIITISFINDNSSSSSSSSLLLLPIIIIIMIIIIIELITIIIIIIIISGLAATPPVPGDRLIHAVRSISVILQTWKGNSYFTELAERVEYGNYVVDEGIM